jgi:colanic acid biosynthesis glycosyl transferase WcaI
MSTESTNTTKQRLWVVSELYYPEETSTGYYLTRIAEGLADSFDVKVLCGQPSYSMRGTRAAKHEFHRGVEIFRVAGTTLDKDVIPFRIVNMVTLGFSVLFAALRRFRRGDDILVVTNPPSMPFVIALAALVKGSAYTLLIHDNYPELLIAAGKAKADALIVKVANFANRWLYKHASKIIVVGRDMADLAAKKTGGLDIPIAVIPNWAELETVEPRPRADNPLLAELGLLDKCVFLYAGNMGHPNDLETIIDAADDPQISETAHFLFLGTGAKRKWLEHQKSERRLGNVTILEPKPRAEQVIFLNACDVALVSLVKGMRSVSMPSRTYNAIAAGKPILALAEAGSEIDRVVAEENIGWRVEPGDATLMVKRLNEICERKQDLSEMGTRARYAALSKYSLETAIGNYKNVLTRKRNR